MQNLWAPWRIQYILGPKADGCILCLDEDRSRDAERLVLYRGKRSFVMMNKYPYCNGHIMVAPFEHAACLTELSEESAQDLMLLTRSCTSILREHFKAQGINIGFNLGEAAGAGVREHLHCHLVPRWNGDSNFMAVLADVRTIPQHIEETYQALLPRFAALAGV